MIQWWDTSVCVRIVYTYIYKCVCIFSLRPEDTADKTTSAAFAYWTFTFITALPCSTPITQHHISSSLLLINIESWHANPAARPTCCCTSLCRSESSSLSETTRPYLTPIYSLNATVNKLDGRCQQKLGQRRGGRSWYKPIWSDLLRLQPPQEGRAAINKRKGERETAKARLLLLLFLWKLPRSSQPRRCCYSTCREEVVVCARKCSSVQGVRDMRREITEGRTSEKWRSGVGMKLSRGAATETTNKAGEEEIKEGRGYGKMQKVKFRNQGGASHEQQHIWCQLDLLTAAKT